MLKMVALGLALSLVLPGAVLANNPSLSAGGSGPPNQYNATPRHVVVWSEPADLNGLIASSELINDFSLETEIANDFVLPGDARVCAARWWGGYYNGNGCGDVGFGTNWNIRFYDDGGCVPVNVILEHLGGLANETSIGCQAGLYPLFEYYVDAFEAPVVGNNLYWFGAQCGNHAFPPQVGRLASMSVVNCTSVFKSAYFSFPDWVSALDVFGVDVDFSQEFYIDCIGSPIQETTWGAVRGLYR